jgi:hypothetical protein
LKDIKKWNSVGNAGRSYFEWWVKWSDYSLEGSFMTKLQLRKGLLSRMFKRRERGRGTGTGTGTERERERLDSTQNFLVGWYFLTHL